MAALRFIVIVFLRLSISSTFKIVNLEGQWNFCSTDKAVCGHGSVPGDIFTDLYRSTIIPDPLFADNHLHLKWVSAINWSYIYSFPIDQTILKYKRSLLVLRGVDTVSSVFLNGVPVLNTSNQFVEYFVNIDGLLRDSNTVEVRFTSPVRYAKEKSHEYQRAHGHRVPPTCPPKTYHGECHPNFIRKAQYSFSWDWGPAIPTVGLWKPVQIIAFDDYIFDDFTWTTERTQDFWIIRGEVRIFTEKKGTETSLRISIPELDVKETQRARVEGGDDAHLMHFKVRIPRDKVAVWWPNGEGEQKLYDITVEAARRKVTHKVGFRHVKLVQDFVDRRQRSKGRHFYVRVNDRPLFLKGSNWIPISMFLSRNNDERMKFLLDSAVEAGMNTLRVWGGGVYESEEFYNYADSKGLLLWQDMMFACALYPTDDEFVRNVEAELSSQIWRLKRHPSILLWAGNNENEIAIRSHWWSVNNYTEADQVRDYVRLYSDVVKPLIKAADSSRPFVLSSPSNGVETEKEGGVSSNPGDPRYGDIHFYNDFINLWRDDSYETPRCATEYGVQSLPFASTMLRHIDLSEWFYTSEQVVHRQHSPTGLITNLAMVFSHFPVPFQCPQPLADLHRCKYLGSSLFIDRYAYFSQANQATTYKVQTEHYRRHRGLLLPSGLGNTMCALYWQLNDVWAAPTWSTIDIDLNWKMAHYEARRFMSPVIVTVYASGVNDMGVTLVNDLPTKIKGARLQLDMMAWTNGFEPIYSEQQSVDVDSLSAKDIKASKPKSRWLTGDADFLIRGRLLDSSGENLAPETVLLPDKLYQIDFKLLGDVSIAEVKQLDKLTYSVTVNATSLSPYTWISVSKRFLGWFSDNGFTMTVPSRVLKLHLREPLDLSRNDFKVCNLKNCGAL